MPAPVLFLKCPFQNPFCLHLAFRRLIIYLVQLVLLVFVNKAYIYVYHYASKLVLNNMLMLLMIGFVMIGMR